MFWTNSNKKILFTYHFPYFILEEALEGFRDLVHWFKKFKTTFVEDLSIQKWMHYSSDWVNSQWQKKFNLDSFRLTKTRKILKILCFYCFLDYYHIFIKNLRLSDCRLWIDATQQVTWIYGGLISNFKTLLDIANDLVYHYCTKHIEVDFHFIREKITKKQIKMDCTFNF